jgi:tetratricopeptide (TPR) repeat protein
MLYFFLTRNNKIIPTEIRRFVSLAIFILLSFFYANGQQSKTIDSLTVLLKTNLPGPQRADVFNKLSYESLKNSDYGKAYLLAEEALKESLKSGYRKGEQESRFNKATADNMQGNFNAALDGYLLALKLAEENKNNEAIVKCMNYIGSINQSQGRYPEALDMFLKSVRIMEQSKVNTSSGAVYLNVSGIYINMGDVDQGSIYTLKAQEVYNRSGDQPGLASTFNMLGVINDLRADYPKAIEYYTKSLELYRKMDNKKNIASSLSNIGLVYTNLGKQQEAAEYQVKALRISEEIGEKQGQAAYSINLGIALLEQGKYREALDYCEKGKVIANEIGALDFVKEACLEMSGICEKIKDPKRALDYYKQYISARDSLINEENTKSTVRLEMNFEFEKKEATAKLEQEKKEAVSAAESRKQRIVIWSVCGILLLVLAFAVFAYRSFLQKKRTNIEITTQKHVIEEKQKEILDSIYYARRIQRALLTHESYIKRNLGRLNK